MRLLPRLLSALPDLALGGTFLITWFRPLAFGDSMLPYAMLTMLLEFFVIHSAAFMGLALWGPAPAWKKTLWVIGLAAMYSTFLLAFGFAAGQWWPMWAFWGLTANRLTHALFHRGPTRVSPHMSAEWGLSVLWYLVWVFATVFLPLPRFGITEEVAAAAGLPGEGLWVDQPHRFVIAGAGYFLCQAWMELAGYTLAGPPGHDHGDRPRPGSRA